MGLGLLCNSLIATLVVFVENGLRVASLLEVCKAGEVFGFPSIDAGASRLANSLADFVFLVALDRDVHIVYPNCDIAELIWIKQGPI